MAILQYNSNTGYYETMEDGHFIQVDGDVFAEAIADAQKSGMTWEQAMNELSNSVNWTGSSPMHGVMIDGVEQE